MKESSELERRTWILVLIGYLSYVLITWTALYASLIITPAGIDAINNRWLDLVWVSFLLAIPFIFVRILTNTKKPITCFLPVVFNLILYLSVILCIWLSARGVPEAILYAVLFIVVLIIFGIIHVSLALSLTIIYYIIDTRKSKEKLSKKGSLLLIFIVLIPVTGMNVEAMADNNHSNDNMTLTFNVIQPRDFTLTYVVIPPLDITEAAGWSVNQSNFLKSVYPISDDADVYLWPVMLPESKVPPEGSSLGDFGKLFIAIYYTGLLVENHQPTRVMGIAPYGFFQDKFNFSIRGYGATPFLTGIAEMTNDETLVAHELGHLYFLCDEYSQSAWNFENAYFSVFDGFQCPNANIGFSFNTSCLTSPQSGCPAQTEAIIRTPSVGLYNFMGSSLVGHSETWVSKETYVHLLNSFDANNEGYLPDVGGIYSSPVSMVSTVVIFGLLDEGNVPTSVLAGKFNHLATLQDSNGSGTYSVRLSNSSGIVKQKYFQPLEGVFADNGTFVNLTDAPFQVEIPINSSITKYEILYNGSVLYEYNISANSPVIQLLSAVGGEVYEDPFVVQWSGADADGDNLTYTVSASNDSGDSWWPLDFDLNVTNITVDNTDFRYGTTYKVKVTANDGFNTNSTQSASSFTIVPPPSVSVESLSELSSAGPRKILEGVILNDGGQTLNQTQWRLDTGEENITAQMNVSLSMNERLFVIAEENYSSGDEKTATLHAEDTTKGVAANASLALFVGDLRAGELYEIYGNVTARIFEFKVWNDDGTNLSGINWSFATGEGGLAAQSPVNVSANESIFVIIAYNYSDTGDYVTTASAADGFNSYNESLAVHIPDITILSYEVLSQLDERAVFGFELKDELNEAMNASWKLSTGAEIVNSTNISLTPGETVFVIAASNYTEYGDFTTKLNATDGRHNRTASVPISIAELLISGVQRLALDATRAVFEYEVTNNFSVNKSTTWSFDTNDTGTITATQAVVIGPDEGFFVIVEHNFTTTGARTVIAGANTTKKNYTQAYNITI